MSLDGLPHGRHAELIISHDTGDDAAVWRAPDGRLQVATTDFFTPIVDDPRDWGRIAATNAVSDVYAMGGTPKVALNLVGWPRAIPFALLAQVLAGARAEDAHTSRFAAGLARVEAAAFNPPEFRTVADEEGLDHRERVQLLASPEVVPFGNLVVGRDAFRRAVELLRALEMSLGGDGFTAAQARDALASTRRVTVPLLEEMARRRLSRSDGRRHRTTGSTQRSASTTNR